MNKPASTVPVKNQSIAYESDSSTETDTSSKVYEPTTMQLTFKPQVLSEDAAKLVLDAKIKLSGEQAEREEHSTEPPTDDCVEFLALQKLGKHASAFLFQMVGYKMLSGKGHLDINLQEFAGIMERDQFKMIAHAKVTDNEYRLRLRYIGGDQFTEDHRNKRSIDLVSKFLEEHFGSDESMHISDCTTKARTLFITAMADQPSGTEMIVSCLNFSLLGAHGFFINWLVTSSELITVGKYGGQFTKIEAMGGNWMNRGLASFLIKTVRLAVAINLSYLGNDLSDLNMVVRARVSKKEISHRFYEYMGFDEIGAVVTPDEKELVFSSFENCLDSAKKSTVDFVHFIENDLNVVTWRHLSWISGPRQIWHVVVPEQKNFGRHIFDKSLIIFRFNIMWEHVLVLLAGLDLLYYPFQENVAHKEFVKPEVCLYDPGETCCVDDSERTAMFTKDRWPGEGSIDFIARWYVLAKCDTISDLSSRDH